MSIFTDSHGAERAPASLPTLVSVVRMSEIEPDLTVGAIRDDLFNRAQNGLEASGAVVYRGRKILLHRERYLAWVIDGRGRHQPSDGRRSAA